MGMIHGVYLLAICHSLLWKMSYLQMLKMIIDLLKMVICHSKLFNNQGVTSRGRIITTHPIRGNISNIMVVIFPINYIAFNIMCIYIYNASDIGAHTNQ